MDLSTFCILFAVLTISYYLLQWSDLFSGKRRPNGPWGLPIVGHILFFGSNPPKTFMKWKERYGAVFQIRMGSWNTVVVNGYDAVKEAADKQDDAFSGRPDFIFRQILRSRTDTGEEGFAFSTFNESYMQQQKLTAKSLRLFTNIRQRYVEQLVQDEAEKLVERLVNKFSDTPGPVNTEVKFTVISTMYQVLYGKQKDVVSDLQALSDSLKEITEFTGSGNPLDVMPWLQYIMPWRITFLKRLIRRNNKLMFDKVEQHYETFAKGNIRDITDALLAEGSSETFKQNYSLSPARLILTLADLQSASFDTTHKTLLWLIIYLTAYPDVQKRVQKELDDVIGRNSPITIGDRGRLVYTEATIYETLRISSVLPFSLPHYAMKDSTIRRMDIAKDTVVLFNLHSVSHEKEFWGDPWAFRPDRLIKVDGSLDNVKLGHIIPFSLGRRRCIGEGLAKMNLFILFATMMQRCSFVKPDGGPLDFEPVVGLTYHPKAFAVYVKRRL